MIPICLGLVVLSVIYLIKTKRKLQRLTLYLNCLFLIYIPIESIWIGINLLSLEEGRADRSDVIQNSKIQYLQRPDIFFILLDEYSGKSVLKNELKYDNDHFYQFLRERKFFVAEKSYSNYSQTPFSMAATFSMDYLTWIGNREKVEAKDYTIAAREVAESRTLKMLNEFGYTIRNFSVFDLPNQPSLFDPGFLALKIKLITDKTMLERIRKSILWGAGNWTGLDAKQRISDGNKKLLELTRHASRENTFVPRFIYTHLMMPHPPSCMIARERN